MTASSYAITPIGEINGTFGDFTISLAPEYRDGLTGLEEFSHAWVLWWSHNADSPAERQRLVEPRPYTGSTGDVGVFGSRSPTRVNPISLTLIMITGLDLEAGVVRTPFIDTDPGTPVIDIKPYFQAIDRVNEVRMPGWAKDWPDSVEASASFDWAAAFK